MLTWQEVDFQRIDGEVGVSGLRDVRADLSRAVCEMFSGHSSGVQRRALIDRLYAEVRSLLFSGYILHVSSVHF